MVTPPRFDELLPHCGDPKLEAMRATLIVILESRAEILPAADSPRGRLWQLVNTPDASAAECAEIISLDSALAMRVLRVANSGAYGGSSDSVTDAVVRIGIGFVREQVYNDGVFKQFSGWELPKEWDAFWLRNLMVARVTERLCAAYGPTNGTEYLAGLLHDMSWIFLAAYFPHEFTYLFNCGLPLSDAEKAYLPYGHAQISAAIAARSLLPERAVNAIAMHHFPVIADVKKVGPPEQNPYFLSVVLQLSDSIADACKLDMFGRAGETFDHLRDSPAAVWLNKLRGTPDLMRIADEELAKSKQIFDAFFAK
ncbi:MAG TPA: HDOD domain-containing protein [Candidatus Methylacidiphilales bacterium]|jgi:HD-like signal output (HDOD) protein|nr:HDOD domain-containing protein [Candidatus Methylacidiphilales bacterium]